MENTNIEQAKNLTILTIQEVASKIKFIDDDATKGWLTKNDIEIHKRGRLNYVYQIEVDCALDIPFAKTLKKKYPNYWEEVYKKVAKDEAVSYLVTLQLNTTIINTPQTKVKVTNDAEQKLLNKLMN